MDTLTFPGHVVVKGHLSPKTMTIPANTLTNAGVAPGAEIDAEKLEHEHVRVYEQEATANAVAEERVVYVARADGEVAYVTVGLVTKPDTATGGGGRTAIVDVKKNGVTILTAAVTLDNADTNLSPVDAEIATADYADGDVFTVAVTLGAGATGTHAKGVFAQIGFREIPAAA